jgi:hypothetical protein
MAEWMAPGYWKLSTAEMTLPAKLVDMIRKLENRPAVNSEGTESIYSNEADFLLRFYSGEETPRS